MDKKSDLTQEIIDEAYDLAIDHAIKNIKALIEQLESLKSKQPPKPYLVNNDLV